MKIQQCFREIAKNIRVVFLDTVYILYLYSAQVENESEVLDGSVPQ